MDYRIERWYITKEIPVLGYIAMVLMVLGACVMIYAFRLIIVNETKQWIQKKRKPLIIFLVIIMGSLFLISAAIVVSNIKSARQFAHFTENIDALLESGDYISAAEALNGHLDTRELQQKYAPIIRENPVLREGLFASGSAVFYGKDYTSKKDDKLMKWYILDKDGKNALLFMAMPDRPYAGYECIDRYSPHGGKWVESDLRDSCLPSDSPYTICGKIFSETELKALKLVNNKSLCYTFDSDGNNGHLELMESEDCLFPLSTDEIIAYDLYAMSSEPSCEDLWGNGATQWWTRTASDYSEMMCVTGTPSDKEYTDAFSSQKAEVEKCIRLAVWVDIDTMLEMWSTE